MLKADDVVIYWKVAKDGSAHSVMVVDRDDAKRDGLSRQAGWYTSGAYFHGWMKGEKSMTPEWVFGELVACFGMSKQDSENAIAQFAKIDCCEWARKMVPDHD